MRKALQPVVGRHVATVRGRVEVTRPPAALKHLHCPDASFSGVPRNQLQHASHSVSALLGVFWYIHRKR